MERSVGWPTTLKLKLVIVLGTVETEEKEDRRTLDKQVRYLGLHVLRLNNG